MDAMFGGELGDGFGLFQEFLHDLSLEGGSVSLFHRGSLPDLARPCVQFMGSSIPQSHVNETPNTLRGKIRVNSQYESGAVLAAIWEGSGSAWLVAAGTLTEK